MNVPEHPYHTTWKIFDFCKDYDHSDEVGEIKDGDIVTVLDVNAESMGITFKVKLNSGVEGWMIILFAGN